MGDKRGLSEMIGYVLLIGIAVILSMIVFVWLKARVPNPQEFCPENTALIISDYECSNGNLKLVLKNQGFFDIDGFVIKGSYSLLLKPVRSLRYTGDLTYVGGSALDREQGILYFAKKQENEFRGLIPGEKTEELEFRIGGSKLYKISIEPIIIKDKTPVFCDNAIIIQKVDSRLCI